MYLSMDNNIISSSTSIWTLNWPVTEDLNKTQSKTSLDWEKINPENIETPEKFYAWLNSSNTFNLQLLKISDLSFIAKLTIIYEIKT